MPPGARPSFSPPDPRQAVAGLVDAARAVESLRHEKLRTLDTGSALLAFSGAYRLARATRTARVDSGLIEQQRWFARAHGRPA